MELASTPPQSKVDMELDAAEDTLRQLRGLRHLYQRHDDDEPTYVN